MKTLRYVLAATFALTALVTISGCTPQIAQHIEVVELNPDIGTLTPSRIFFLLPDSTRLPYEDYVGRVSSVVTHQGRSTLDRLYPELRRQANEMGANAFKVYEGCSGSGPCELIIDLFLAPDEIVDQGPAQLPLDAVIVFGSIQSGGDSVRFRLNGESMEIPPFRYVVYLNTEESLNLSVGGALGASMTLQGGRGRSPSYWSLTGFGVGPGQGGRAMSMSFNTGRIHPVERTLGLFLVAVLEGEEL